MQSKDTKRDNLSLTNSLYHLLLQTITAKSYKLGDSVAKKVEEFCDVCVEFLKKAAKKKVKLVTGQNK